MVHFSGYLASDVNLLISWTWTDISILQATTHQVGLIGYAICGICLEILELGVNQKFEGTFSLCVNVRLSEEESGGAVV